ncbi:MAG: hypothetical protein KZQ97_16745 [Candidatus Thiodiazotropha sp. (ex Dulcina madagascariensis)]|nr:hypothetical protein [Candidatus Thiodiazotropha sp. (ex Dulcina madagascariensis)]
MPADTGANDLWYWQIRLRSDSLDSLAKRITVQGGSLVSPGVITMPEAARFIGKEARSFQTWSIAGFIAAHEMLAQPQHVELFSYEENPTVVACSLRVADEMAHAR